MNLLMNDIKSIPWTEIAVRVLKRQKKELTYQVHSPRDSCTTATTAQP